MTPHDDAQLPCRYRPIAEIGRGGMGEIFLAVAHGVAGFRKLIVLKRARPDLADEPEFLAMFLDEARLAARLNHPNVVQTYEAGQEAGRYFIAMEYLDGQPLHRIRARVEPRCFPLSMQIRILIEALAGLHHAHELTDFDGTPLEVIHRDATPQNIFVTYDGQVKVVDFGIAKAANSTIRTRAGMIRGKVTYMAPEQARREPLDRRADIFAVGVMLWETVAGERMWKGLTDTQIVRRLATGKLPSLEVSLPDSDPELKRIIRRALAHLPANRYATAAELQQDLERWLARQGEEVPARVIGTFVAAHFEKERAMTKAVIEQELRDYCSNFTLRRVLGVDPRAGEFEETMVDSRYPSKRGPLQSSEFSITLTAPAEGSPLIQAVTMAAECSPRVAVLPPNPETSPLDVPVTLRSPRAALPPTLADTALTASASTRSLRTGPVAARAVDSAPRSSCFRIEEQEKPFQSPLSIAPVVEPLSAPRSQGRLWKRLAIWSPILISAAVTVAALGFRLPEAWLERPSTSPPAFMASVHTLAARDVAKAADMPAKTGEIDLSVCVLPATARIFINGALVSTGWYKDRLPRDGRVHWIYVEAPNFVPMEQSITASGDVSLSLALEPQFFESAISSRFLP